MGWITDPKAKAVETLVTEAKMLIAAGRNTFTPTLSGSQLKPGRSGSVGGWVEMIEAIEAEGWVMQFWSVTDTTSGIKTV